MGEEKKGCTLQLSSPSSKSLLWVFSIQPLFARYFSHTALGEKVQKEEEGGLRWQHLFCVLLVALKPSKLNFSIGHQNNH